MPMTNVPKGQFWILTMLVGGMPLDVLTLGVVPCPVCNSIEHVRPKVVPMCYNPMHPAPVDYEDEMEASAAEGARRMLGEKATVHAPKNMGFDTTAVSHEHV